MGYGNKRGSGIKIVMLVVVVVLALAVLDNKGKQRAVAGIKDPVQEETTGQTHIFVDDYDITVSYLYTYDISALVVSTHNYWGGGVGDKLAPRDLALAWGDVAAYNKTIDFHWKQSGRWYSWQVNTYDEVDQVGGVQGVTEHSSNNHLIAADESVRKAIKKIKVGDYVRLKGYLVNLDGTKPDGSTFYWHSSTTRSDSGAHSCEVMYVTGVERLN